MSSLIQIENLSYTYGSHQVLSEISLEIEEGALLFIMGNNGSGKTTLLRCLLGGEAPPGTVRYQGEDISRIGRVKLARLVSYVPQNIHAGCDYKVRDYLVLGRNPYISWGNPQRRDYELVALYAQRTGITDILDKPFDTLSGGQRQWVAITRALVQETPVIMMDEPMSALDMGRQAELLCLLRDLREREGKTVILTSHNPNHCTALDCLVCLLRRTRLYRSGTPRQVLTEETVAEIYGEHVRIMENGQIGFSIGP